MEIMFIMLFLYFLPIFTAKIIKQYKLQENKECDLKFIWVEGWRWSA